jgi:hypothetical protein
MTTSDHPKQLEERYLAELRDRVAWQAEAADRLRRGLPLPPRTTPVRAVPDPEPKR